MIFLSILLIPSVSFTEVTSSVTMDMKKIGKYCIHLVKNEYYCNTFTASKLVLYYCKQNAEFNLYCK